MICAICGKECEGYKGLGSHIKLHDIDNQTYYDTYIDTNTNLCAVCGKKNVFQGLGKGYTKHCSNKCGQLDIESQKKRKQTKLLKYGDENYTNREKAIQTMKNLYGVENISQKVGFGDKVKQTKLEHFGNANYNNRDKAKQTCLELYDVENPYQIQEVVEKAKKNNYTDEIYKKRNSTRYAILDEFEQQNHCIRIGKLIQQYGQGWLLIKDNLNLIYYHGSTFVGISDIKKIIDYVSQQTHGTSQKEQSISDELSEYNVIRRTKQIISPYELDFYLPDYQLAIEFNGTYWHSFESNGQKDYHLMKSLLCREKNIRLIHIYEFEDIQKQIELVKSLISGVDLFPKEDFNKNNLISTIPQPKIIYKDRFTVYGAGKLY